MELIVLDLQEEQMRLMLKRHVYDTKLKSEASYLNADLTQVKLSTLRLYSIPLYFVQPSGLEF